MDLPRPPVEVYPYNQLTYGFTRTRPPVEVYPHNQLTYGFTKTTSRGLST